MARYYKYCTARTCGGLKETLDTECPITKDVFVKLVSIGIYKFYAYDLRIKADRYLLVNIIDNYGLPQWLHDYTLQIKGK